MFPFFLTTVAHGALGYADEIMFFGMGIVVIVIMVLSWWTERQRDEQSE